MGCEKFLFLSLSLSRNWQQKPIYISQLEASLSGKGRSKFPNRLADLLGNNLSAFVHVFVNQNCVSFIPRNAECFSNQAPPNCSFIMR